MRVDDGSARNAVSEQRTTARQAMTPAQHRTALERLYETYNRPEFIHPDPMELILRFDDVRDREVVGLVSSCLAYGRVAQIMKSAAAVIGAMGQYPGRFVRDADEGQMRSILGGFKHRFSTADELVLTLLGAQRLIRRYGSLEEAFASGLAPSDRTVAGALCRFAEQLNAPFFGGYNSLIPHHTKGSSMKRLNLLLRWMVRKDAVDPGGWNGVSAAQLIVPLDTHLFRIACVLGFTKRRSAGLAAALEITERFREIAPDDPVRYDFALTRLGIRAELRGRALSPYDCPAD